jgi:hypothetical protein
MVKAEYWIEEWLPFTLDAGGNVLAIDLYPDVDQEMLSKSGVESDYHARLHHCRRGLSGVRSGCAPD